MSPESIQMTLMNPRLSIFPCLTALLRKEYLLLDLFCVLHLSKDAEENKFY